ncbi:MAG: nucleotidyltransferase substrate binding protein [Nitrospirae bacterium]|nr:nucleotidyltransferase substrate binding protein [Nitrospirota bacterium]
MPLVLNSLKKAIAALNAILAKSNDAGFMRGLDEITQNAIKSGAIKHFEFTYELCWKFMKRRLSINISPTTAEGVTRRELFRLAAENRLIDDFEQWMRYHDAISQTSHIYESEIAEKVYLTAHDFVRDAKRLLEALEARND